MFIQQHLSPHLRGAHYITEDSLPNPHMASWLEIALNLGKSFTNTEVTNTVFPTKQSYIQNALHLRRPIAVFSQIFNHFKKKGCTLQHSTREQFETRLKTVQKSNHLKDKKESNQKSNPHMLFFWPIFIKGNIKQQNFVTPNTIPQ